MPTFTANRISANHNILFPDRLYIEDDRVVYYKGAIIGYQSTVIPRASISSVRINSNILFADVIIESAGGRRIEINGLSKSDSQKIYQYLTSELNV